MQLVYTELCKEADLHSVVALSEDKALEDYRAWKALTAAQPTLACAHLSAAPVQSMCRELIIGVYEPKTWELMNTGETVGRAGVTTATAATVEIITQVPACPR